MEYWLSLLKVATIVVSHYPSKMSPRWRLLTFPTQVFIIVGIAVNCGGNVDNQYIGGRYWNMGDAPFVGGIGGFASVFVTASFA
jgi:AAT family amino acid transporter